MTPHRAAVWAAFDDWFRCYQQGAWHQAASAQRALRRLTSGTKHASQPDDREEASNSWPPIARLGVGWRQPAHGRGKGHHAP